MSIIVLTKHNYSSDYRANQSSQLMLLLYVDQKRHTMITYRLYVVDLVTTIKENTDST
jgi:hypothetical protein